MALDPEVAKRWEGLTGGMLVEGYGLTETSPIALGNPMSDARRPSMLGIPFPSTEIKILGDSPTHGELLIRGPQVFSGYWNQPEETAAVLDADGWLHTGDVVELETDGFVRLVDRIKEVIVTGGFNVYPSEVEQSVALMPEVDEVAVVGLPGSDLGERVVAAIVLAPGAALNLDQVRAWCSEHVPHFAIPRELVVMDSLPRSQIGKVLRRAVQASIVAALAAGTVGAVRHNRTT
jgi:long-chain acyl-CoA synthetase